MQTYRRRTRVDAPLDVVWRFHLDPRGLAAVSPGWLDLRIDDIRGPEGGREPEQLAAGTVVRVSVRPGGVGPRQRWATRILSVEREAGAAWFRDEMVEGPFPTWEHTHAFYADEGGTILQDRLDYELPLGPLRGPLDRLGVIGLAPMFRFRHRRTRALLDGLETPDRIDDVL